MFRELPVMDFGIDAQIETVAMTLDSERAATGRLLSVQVKTGKSYFSNDDGDAWSVYIAKATVHYWNNHSVPVLLVLVNPETGDIFWVRGDSANHQATKESFRIKIPKANALTAAARDDLIDIAENTTPEGRRLARLDADLPVIASVVRGDHVVIDLMHWHNKSSGRIDYWIGTPGANPTRDGPSDIVPATSGSVAGTGGDVLSTAHFIVPWAEAVVDDDCGEEAEEGLYDEYLAETGTWDSEDGVYIDSHGTFAKWLTERRPAEDGSIREYYIDGEVTRYRLKLSANELGRSFIHVKTFLSSE